jgi:phage tail sheath protein FI
VPEYLHPGVYIEETSYRGKPIEGVSTSTAGLVGRTTKGPEGVPTLITSFAEFRRQFGEPVAIVGTANPGDYLGHAVRAFFENGGRRAYIVRTLPADAATAFTTLPAGLVWHVAATRVLRPGQTVIPLVSTRGIRVGDELRLFVRGPAGWGTQASAHRAVAAVDLVRNEITVAALTAADFWPTATAADSVNADAAFWLPAGAGPTFTAVPPAGAGPSFRALHRGAGGNDISVQIRAADRPAVAIRTAAGAATDVLEVASTGGFYTGAIVEITRGGGARDYQTVRSVDPGNRRIQLGGNTGGAVATTDFIRTLEIDVLVYEKGALRESFTGLTWNPATDTASFARNYVSRINDSTTGSRLVRVVTTVELPFPPPPAVSLGAPQPPVATLTAAGQPVTPDGFPVALTTGSDGSMPLSSTDLIGVDNGPGRRTGIEALRERTDISLVAVPGVFERSVQSALLTHCELLKYRFAVLDGLNSSDVSAIQAHRNGYDSRYGGYYTPWLETMDLATGRTMLVPPSGHVLGICARVDSERGVHKAPANEVVRGITGISLRFGDGEQDVLNPAGVNLIREFEGRGIRVWGGRCTTSDSEWKYVNVRRLFIFLEHSIDRGTQWVVFEPNSEALWQRVVETIESFLFGVWKSGALMGTTPEQAYFVRCDRTTMTQDDIDNGRLVCLIGVAPAYPAEFVIFRIGQFTASSNA